MSSDEHCPHDSHPSYCLECIGAPKTITPTSARKPKATRSATAGKRASANSAVLFVWNPQLWAWDDLTQVEEITQSGATYVGTWSAGSRRNFTLGERVFLFRVAEDRGIVASGAVKSEPFTEDHWDGSGRKELFVEIEFDRVHARELAETELARSIPTVHWEFLQSSGARVPDASAIIDLWESHCNELDAC